MFFRDITKLCRSRQHMSQGCCFPAYLKVITWDGVKWHRKRRFIYLTMRPLCPWRLWNCDLITLYRLKGCHICCLTTVNSWTTWTQMLSLLIYNHVLMYCLFYMFTITENYCEHIKSRIPWYSQIFFLNDEDNLLLIAFYSSTSDISRTKTPPLKKH